MDVTRYTFQSPYPSQIQVGKPDTSVSKEGGASNLSNGTNEVLQKAKEFESSNKQEVKPSVETQNLLDVTV